MKKISRINSEYSLNCSASDHDMHYEKPPPYLISFFFCWNVLFQLLVQWPFSKNKNAVRVVTDSKLSYRECGICVAVLSALKTFSHHTNWEICDFLSFHLLWRSTDLTGNFHRQQMWMILHWRNAVCRVKESIFLYYLDL